MTTHSRRALAAVTAVVLGACSGATNIFHGVIDDRPPATEAQVVAMLNFDPYVNVSYIRRQRLLASCENLRTFYNQVERSWPKKGKVEASYRIAKNHTDSVEVSLWSSQTDKHPATWRLPRKGPVGLKLDALGKKALTVTCTRPAAR